jgi:uncharacterized membrane protein YhaH (DUF805 family)
MADQISRPKARPGWYPHPRMADTQRYWDGERWTSHIAPMAPKPTVTVRQLSTIDRSGEVVGACVLAVVLPIVGFFYGAYLVTKDEPKGWLAIVVSAVAFLVWVTVLSLRANY